MLKNWLNKPYPLITKAKDKWLVVFGFSIFVFAFLSLYQPFGAAQITANRSLYLAGFAGCVFLVLTFTYLLLPVIAKNWFNPETWNLRKEITLLSGCILGIALLNYLYNSSVGRHIAPQHSLVGFVGITFSVGVFPLVILIFLTEKYLSQKNNNKALKLTKQLNLKAKNHKGQTLTIVPETLKSAPLQIELANFLYAVSDNNYTTVFYLDNGDLKQELLRVSIKNVAQQLSRVPEILRCHKSYLINKNQIVAVTGNARSLNLTLANCPTLIPVSRNLDKNLLV